MVWFALVISLGFILICLALWIINAWLKELDSRVAELERRKA
ncbi:hypothetical protein LCGC14_0338550 [marine sediment metagenome]|uniref:Uncharacterized protein n=1 Tax=marine sediment metagenome TaxID=412755 RepID=A0A0F9W1T6_9ZZZZ